MAPKISAPVGLRHRRTNVANKAADQAVVIDLLAKIADKCGGKGSSWASPPSPGADGTCPEFLADAIWDFQSAWQIRGLLHSIDGVVDPGGHTLAQLTAMTQAVCGPKVDDQFKAVLTRIQTDFGTWNTDQKNLACTQLLVPLQPASGKSPTFKEIGSNPTKLLTLAGIKPDINGWDVLPLFQGHAQWLRSQRVLSKSCAVPSSPKPTAGAFDAAHEDPCTCSDSVQIGGKCWLAGTVNYGTFGVMVRLCADEFVNPALRGVVLLWASQFLIKGYKKFISKEDPTLPIAWLEATFNGGPAATPTVAGNRPDCKCSCSLDGSLVKWDYVWEPVKPRGTAATPTIYDVEDPTR